MQLVADVQLKYICRVLHGCNIARSLSQIVIARCGSREEVLVPVDLKACRERECLEIS
jgi:hypothetical protein